MKGMIAGDRHRIGQSAKDPGFAVKNLIRLSMHRNPTGNHLGPQCLSDHLMSETDSQNRQLTSPVLEGLPGQSA